MHYCVLEALPYFGRPRRMCAKSLGLMRRMSDRLDHPPALAEPNTVAPARVVGQPVSAPRAETVRLYAADWLDFVGWCRANGRRALPASAETFSGYLLAMAPGRSRGALGRRRAAIGTMHRQQGLAVPALDAAARAALRRTARRT